MCEKFPFLKHKEWEIRCLKLNVRLQWNFFNPLRRLSNRVRVTKAELTLTDENFHFCLRLAHLKSLKLNFHCSLDSRLKWDVWEFGGGSYSDPERWQESKEGENQQEFGEAYNHLHEEYNPSLFAHLSCTFLDLRILYRPSPRYISMLVIYFVAVETLILPEMLQIRKGDWKFLEESLSKNLTYLDLGTCISCIRKDDPTVFLLPKFFLRPNFCRFHSA
jgi:hypothetical protein